MKEIDSPETKSLNHDPLLSVTEAAIYLGISRSKMYEIAEREKLPCVRITSDRKIRRSILDKYVQTNESPWCWQ